MNERANLPVIPEYVTVHLGSPRSSARNVTVPFTDYIKNVASSEIYPTWPESAIRANVLAQISFTLNRIYTEYYRSRGYDFDITNSTAIDQSFVEGRDIFENISRIVDEIFNNYLVRDGSVEPLFASYCDGVEVSCGGLSQWGSAALAENGAGTYDILTRYYGDNINIVTAPVAAADESYSGRVYRRGSSGDDVRAIQTKLNRISRNYPAIPKISNPVGVFGEETENAVKAFQRIFSLTPDGAVGKATWYKIQMIYASVKKLSDLNSEGIRLEDVIEYFPEVLEEGTANLGVRELQYFLAVIAEFDESVPPIEIDGIFGPKTRAAVEAYQRQHGLAADGIVGPLTWDSLYRTYVGIVDSQPAEFGPGITLLYPGSPLQIGDSGRFVSALQEYLNYIGNTYTQIPKVDVDGQFGPATARAASAYQRLFGINPDGIVGSLTWSSITDTYRSLYESTARTGGQYGGEIS